MRPSQKRKLVYGIHGYGRGHAARALAILPDLTDAYDVLLLAGDDAYHHLRGDFPVVRIPTLRYLHDSRARRSAWLTISRHMPAALDMIIGGPIYRMVRAIVEEFAPDAVLSDSEGWTHRAARDLGIGRISFDHYGILAYCDVEMPSAWDRFVCSLESRIYRRLICDPREVIVTAFFDAPPRRAGVTVVGPVLRSLVRRTEPTQGDFLLAYFSNPSVNFLPNVEQALRGLTCPVKVYGPPRTGRDGHVEYCRIANEPFVRDLAACRAVFSTAGNQLISEAIHFGKPLLVMPEEALEQRLNGQFIELWGIGQRTRPAAVTAGLLEGFLARAERYSTGIGAHRRDGHAEAVAAIGEAIERAARR